MKIIGNVFLKVREFILRFNKKRADKEITKLAQKKFPKHSIKEDFVRNTRDKYEL